MCVTKRPSRFCARTQHNNSLIASPRTAAVPPFATNTQHQSPPPEQTTILNVYYVYYYYYVLRILILLSSSIRSSSLTTTTAVHCSPSLSKFLFVSTHTHSHPKKEQQNPSKLPKLEGNGKFESKTRVNLPTYRNRTLQLCVVGFTHVNEGKKLLKTRAFLAPHCPLAFVLVELKERLVLAKDANA